MRFEPAQAVGGDFYAFFPGGARLGVLLGDVSGKGIPAALASTSISQLAWWLRPMEDPDGFLANMNRELLEHLRPEAFASLVLAFLDPEAGRAVISPAILPVSSSAGRAGTYAVGGRALAATADRGGGRRRRVVGAGPRARSGSWGRAPGPSAARGSCCSAPSRRTCH